jgi:phage tail-like protein
MAEFTVNTTRHMPYQGRSFKIKMDGVYVAGLSKMGPLTRTTTVVTHRVGGDPSRERKSPGLTSFDAAVLEQGVTHDLAFEAWANKISDPDAPGVSLADFRKDLIIDLFNEGGQLVMSYQLFRCWVSEYTALPQLDAATAGVAIRSIKIEMESWSRDRGVTEPVEQSF